MLNLKQYSSTTLFKFASAHKLAVLGFVSSVVAVVVLSSTILADAIYFNDPRHQDVELQSWMTPRYVCLSYDLPRPLMKEILGIEEEDFDGRPRRLDHYADNIGVSLGELTNIVRIAATAHRVQDDD
jgi:hypothetical protein